MGRKQASFHLKPQLPCAEPCDFQQRIIHSQLTETTVKVHCYLEAPQVTVAAFRSALNYVFPFFQGRSDNCRDLHRLRRRKRCC